MSDEQPMGRIVLVNLEGAVKDALLDDHFASQTDLVKRALASSSRLSQATNPFYVIGSSNAHVVVNVSGHTYLSQREAPYTLAERALDDIWSPGSPPIVAFYDAGDNVLNRSIENKRLEIVSRFNGAEDLNIQVMQLQKLPSEPAVKSAD